MSDLATPIDHIAEAQIDKEETANAFMDAASWAALFAMRDVMTSGLTWGVYGGRFNGNVVANDTLTLTASATNYVVVARATGVASVSTSGTNWANTATYGHAYLVETDSAGPTDWEDHRYEPDGILAAGIGSTTSPGGSDTYVQYNDSSAFGGDARLTFNETTKITTGQFAVDSNAVNAQTGTSYTLVAADNGKVVTLSNAAAITVTVPASLGAGFSCICIQIGAGQVTFAASSTTINPSTTLKIAAQHGAASLIAYAANVFNLSGEYRRVIILQQTRGVLFKPSAIPVTWNPSDKHTGVTLSNGNLTAAITSGGVRGTTAHSTGKYYYEVRLDTINVGANSPGIGVMSAGLNITSGAGVWYGVTDGGCGYPAPAGVSFYSNNGAPISLGIGLVTNDVEMYAIDFATGKFWIGLNGTWRNSGNPAAGTNPILTFTANTTLFPGTRGASAQCTARFASGSWGFSAPSGFSAW